MKNKIIFGAILMMIAAVALVVFFPNLRTVADKDFPYEGDEPDLPGFAKSGLIKEEFMSLRAKHIGLLHGVDETKPVDPHLRQTAIAEMERQQSDLAEMPDSTEKDALTAAWTPIGPAPIPNGQTVSVSTPVSGRTISIAVHPTNPDIVYVGTAQGGLYRSTDGGTHWTPMLDNALSLAIGAVAIAPSQPDTVYVGTGEGNFAGTCFFGVGVYRIDNASSGSPIITGPLNKNSSNADIFTGRGIGKIVVHPTDPATIFVASTSGFAGIGGFQTTTLSLPNVGVYRTTNATSANPTFTQIGPLPAPNNNFSVHDIAMDPLNPNLLVANLVASGGGIYVSTNALATNPTFTNTQTFTGGTSETNTEFAIQHTPGNTNPVIYAATGNQGGRVLVSTNGGSSWTQQIDNNFCGGQCFYDIAVAVDPTNPAKVYLGGDPTLVFAFSNNSGTSFTKSESGLHGDSHVIAVAPSQPSTLYFGSDGGIYKSTNSGASWTPLNNTQFSATQFMSIAVHPTDPNFSIGGTQDNGTNFYRPNATWTRADFGDGGYSLIDQNAADTTNVRMYHTYFNVGSLQGYGTVSSTASASDGNWTFRGCQAAGATANGITCSGSTLFYAPLEQGPGNPNTVYYGTDRLYRSVDAGLNHTAASQNPIRSGVPISAIGISPQNDNVRIVGLADGGIFGTTAGSTTLTNLDPSNAVPNGFIARSVIDPTNVNTAYVTLSAFGVINVWKTTNLNSGSPTWTPVAGNGGSSLPPVPVSAFLVDPTNPNTLYAGTDIGAYTSSDGGASWQPFGTGLPRVSIFDMAITASSNRKLRIATHGRGMWDIPLNAACEYSITPTSQNFPASGGSGSVQVTTTSGCPWTATSNSLANPDRASGNSNLSDVSSESDLLKAPPTNAAQESNLTAAKTENPNNIVSSPNAVFPGTGVGAIADGTSTGYGTPLVVNFAVSGVTGSLTTVSVNMTLTHTWVGDLDVVLAAPGGSPSIPVFSRVGSTTATGFGDSSDLGGTYTFNDAATGNFWTAAATAGPTDIVPPGGYRTSAPLTGAPTNLTATFSGLTAAQANGTWTLTFRDGALGDTGTVTAANLEVQSNGGGGNWITITSGSNGIGNGIVNYTVAQNNTGQPRTGTMTIAGQTFTVNQASSTPNARRLFDFDGDGKADISVFRPDNGAWYLLQSQAGFTGLLFGLSTDLLVPADYDGDGKTDVAVVRNGTWYLQRSQLGFTGIAFGDGNDIPVPADYDGDGKADLAVFRPSNGGWYIQRSQLGFTGLLFGQTGDKPVAADYDGDGKADVAVNRAGTWYIQRSQLGFTGIAFGDSNDKSVPADYDGDGKADVAVFRPSNGIWYLQQSSAGFTGVAFGVGTDLPAAADYDGDGKSDLSVFRPSIGTWYLQRSTQGFTGVAFGSNGDKPIPNAFVR